MRHSVVGTLVVVVMAALCVGVATPASMARQARTDRLDAYTAIVPTDQVATVAREGFDVAGGRHTARGSRSTWC